MSQQDLQIRLKVEEMILYAYSPLRNFPKAEKHVLSAEIRQCMFRLLRLVVVVNRRYHKKTTMQDLDAELDLLRSYVRLSHELTFLPFRQYEIWSRQLAELGRMIGGWLNWAKAQS
ncbi:diversity-generating retroelement protein Avd [Halopseudomonas bauzanensis]|nr:diversity-generating retroelement protein Avd [Halopseudomonas litoralis]